MKMKGHSGSQPDPDINLLSDLLVWSKVQRKVTLEAG